MQNQFWLYISSRYEYYFFLYFFNEILAKFIIISFHRKTRATFFHTFSTKAISSMYFCESTNLFSDIFIPISQAYHRYSSITLIRTLQLLRTTFFLPRFQFHPPLQTLVFVYLHYKKSYFMSSPPYFLNTALIYFYLFLILCKL